MNALTKAALLALTIGAGMAVVVALTGGESEGVVEVAEIVNEENEAMSVTLLVVDPRGKDQDPSRIDEVTRYVEADSSTGSFTLRCLDGAQLRVLTQEGDGKRQLRTSVEIKPDVCEREDHGSYRVVASQGIVTVRTPEDQANATMPS
jgi:pyruvate-formate lyase-activating enzyme